MNDRISVTNANDKADDRGGAALHNDHRRRMADKIRKFGFESLKEHEQLEVILYNPIPRGDTNEIAHRLIKRFGSAYNVLIADPKLLQEVEGVGPKTAAYLNSLIDITGAVQRFEIESKCNAVLADAETAARYVISLFHGKAAEHLYIISLGSSKRVLAVDRITNESPDKVITTVAEIASKAIMNRAKYVVMAHNHPGGSLEPSVSDIRMQRAVNDGLETLQIKLEYNFIVSGGRAKCVFNRGEAFGI